MLVQILKNYVIIKINNLSVLPNAAVTSDTPTDSGITNGHSSTHYLIPYYILMSVFY